MKKILLFFVLSPLLSGCATTQINSPKTQSRDTRITVPKNGDWLWGEKVTIYNLAGKNITIVPLPNDRLYLAEYKLGNRGWWCLWLCYEWIATKFSVLHNNESVTIPFKATISDYYQRSMPLMLEVIENGVSLGKYFCCISYPLNNHSYITNQNQNVKFEKETLAAMKAGRHGRMCQEYKQYW